MLSHLKTVLWIEEIIISLQRQSSASELYPGLLIWKPQIFGCDPAATFSVNHSHSHLNLSRDKIDNFINLSCVCSQHRILFINGVAICQPFLSKKSFLLFICSSFDVLIIIFTKYIALHNTDLSSTSSFIYCFDIGKKGPSPLRVGCYYTVFITIRNVKYASGLIIINNYRADIKFPFVSFRLLNLNLISHVHIS